MALIIIFTWFPACQISAFPFPACNLGKVETVFMDVLLMLNKLVAHLLIEICPTVSE